MVGDDAAGFLHRYLVENRPTQEEREHTGHCSRANEDKAVDDCRSATDVDDRSPRR